MSQKMNLHVLMIKRGEVEGNKYASIITVSDTPTYENDFAGLSVLKMSCEHSLIDRIDRHLVPGDFIAEVDLVMAAGGKAGLKILGLTPVKKG